MVRGEAKIRTRGSAASSELRPAALARILPRLIQHRRRKRGDGGGSVTRSFKAVGVIGLFAVLAIAAAGCGGGGGGSSSGSTNSSGGGSGNVQALPSSSC